MKASFAVVFFCAVAGLAAWFIFSPLKEPVLPQRSVAAEARPEAQSGFRGDSRVHASASPLANWAANISDPSSSNPPLQSGTPPTLEQRLARLEAAVTQLQNAFDGVSLEKASAERQA